ncbi:hypothetical protein PHMEG_00031530 [Phytophthora megakarya]|uniref:Uncharacterized protein n=1 Tax=Phytophthora megakarya TaxID=4795 RepID=A0A225V097_9STRA|nr:hypothetical protein PHMEG_00031530 [Phytophthora megakarya]
MNHTVRLVTNQPTSSCEVSKTKMHPAQEEITPHPSFASRMIRLVFKRRQPTKSTEQRAKSWPGRPESIPGPVSDSCQSSAMISTPNNFSSSQMCTTQTTSTRSSRIRKRTADKVYDETDWRQRQTYCANCEQLFFTFLSTLSNGADRFCCLDCKTNFEFVTRLQNIVDLGFGEVCMSSSGWSGSSW